MNIIKSWFFSTIIFLLISSLTIKYNLYNLAKSTLKFSIFYLMAYFIGELIFKQHVYLLNFNNLNNLNVLIFSSIIWFLISNIIQKKSIYKSLKSTGIYIMFYLLAEIMYTLFDKYNIL